MRKYYIKNYWMLWFFLIIIFFLSKFFSIPCFTKLLALPYFLIILLIIQFLYFLSSQDLKNYVRNNYSKNWEELIITPLFGPLFINEFKQLDFSYSENYLNDEKLLMLKKRYKGFRLLMVIHFFCMPIIIIVLTLLGKKV